MPERKIRRAEVKPEVEVGRQPRPVLIWGLASELPGQPDVGSKARTGCANDKRLRVKKIGKLARYVRMELCFLSGKNFFIPD